MFQILVASMIKSKEEKYIFLQILHTEQNIEFMIICILTVKKLLLVENRYRYHSMIQKKKQTWYFIIFYHTNVIMAQKKKLLLFKCG